MALLGGGVNGTSISTGTTDSSSFQRKAFWNVVIFMVGCGCVGGGGGIVGICAGLGFKGIDITDGGGLLEAAEGKRFDLGTSSHGLSGLFIIRAAVTPAVAPARAAVPRTIPAIAPGLRVSSSLLFCLSASSSVPWSVVAPEPEDVPAVSEEPLPPDVPVSPEPPPPDASPADHQNQYQIIVEITKFRTWRTTIVQAFT